MLFAITDIRSVMVRISSAMLVTSAPVRDTAAVIVLCRTHVEHEQPMPAMAASIKQQQTVTNRIIRPACHLGSTHPHATVDCRCHCVPLSDLRFLPLTLVQVHYPVAVPVTTPPHVSLRKWRGSCPFSRETMGKIGAATTKTKRRLQVPAPRRLLQRYVAEQPMQRFFLSGRLERNTSETNACSEQRDIPCPFEPLLEPIEEGLIICNQGGGHTQFEPRPLSGCSGSPNKTLHQPSNLGGHNFACIADSRRTRPG